MPRIARYADVALLAVASVLAASVLVAAWHDVSQAYDVWYYHVPFAGRLAGVLDAGSYTFSAENQARFDGFPLFCELLMGIVWRATGHVQATNLVSALSLLALPVFLRKMYGVPMHIAFLALFAIPLVQIHATSSYVDLPANAFVTMLILCVHRAWIDRAALTPRFLVGCGALAATAANSKFQLVPIVGVCCLGLAALVVKTRSVRHLAILVVAAPLVLATPIKNLAVHHNPVWPVAFGSFPSVERAYASSPPGLEDSWRPTRWARSVLEIDNEPIASHARWSLDQWTPPSSPAYRMGGFFGAYVVVGLAGLIASRRRDLAVVLGVVTVVAAFVPQSHELRYYLHWMLLLVALNLIAWREKRIAVGAIAAAALAIVAWSTEGGYLYASGTGFDAFLTKRVDPALITPGRVCLERPPFTVLYAPLFHRGLPPYTVQEKAAESDCR